MTIDSRSGMLRFLPLTCALILLFQPGAAPRLSAAGLSAPALAFHGNGCSYRGTLWGLGQSTSKEIDAFWNAVRKGYNGNYPPPKNTKGSVVGPTAQQAKAVKQALAQVVSAIGGPSSGLEGRIFSVTRQYGVTNPAQGGDAFTRPATLLLRTLATVDQAAQLETSKGWGKGYADYAFARSQMTDAWTALKAVPCVYIYAEPPAISHLAKVKVQSITFYVDPTFDGPDCTPIGRPSSVFAPGTRRMWVYVQYVAWQGRHTDRFEWIAPNGRLYSSDLPTPYVGSGPTTDCDWMALSGTGAARQRGRWWFHLVVDGKVVGAAPFTVL